MLDSVNSILGQLRKAKDNLDLTRDKFKDNPALLRIYEPSAIEMVNIYEQKLQEVIKNVAGVELSIEKEKDIDIWIHIEGENFRDGKGPVELVGDYLQKLNLSCKKVFSMLESDICLGSKESLFYLADTAQGSLKLGLKKSSYIGFEIEEQDTNEESNLFREDATWNKMKLMTKKEERITETLELIFDVMECADSEEKMEKLKGKLGDDGKLIKLLNYTKDLTPSKMSCIDNISFEYLSKISNKQKVVSLDSDVRRKILNYSKKILKGKEYVNGVALIRSQDMDRKKITARPFKFDNKMFDNLECKFSNECPIQNYLDQFVNLSGFLMYGNNNIPVRLDIDTISIKEVDD